MDTAVCEGSSTTLAITGGNLNNSFAWQWYSDSCGGTSAGTGTSISVSPSVSTSYFVRGEGGCSANGLCTTLLIAVNPLPNVSASSASATVCRGDSLTLTGNGTISYVWNGPQAIQDNVPFAATTGGTYILAGTDANGCTDTASATIIVNSLPIVTVSLPFNTICFNDAPVLLTGGSPPGGLYSGTGVTNNSFDPSVAGNGVNTIQYTYTDSNGCTDSATQQIIIDACVGMPDTNMEPDMFHLYPNPNNGQFTFGLNGALEANVSIYNAIGELVWQQRVMPGAQQIIMKQQPPGIYLLKLMTAKGICIQQRLIIE